MESKILIVAVIKNGNKVLLRKKPDGSPPYSQTWYIFGAEFNASESIEETINNHIKRQAGINIGMVDKMYWDTEIKKDLDGKIKHFIYLDVVCEYKSGELIIIDGVEKLEWVEIENLANYDNVPPSIKLFKRLGYL